VTVSLNWDRVTKLALDQRDAVMLVVKLQDAGEFLGLLAAGLPITVTTDAGKILLSAPNIKDLKDRWGKVC
jgi:hypothetical protein